MKDWVIIPYEFYGVYWALYSLDRRVSKQDYARKDNGAIRRFTTRSGARGVRSRLRAEKGA